MSDSEDLKKILDSNEILSKKVDELFSTVGEDAKAYSIYFSAKERLMDWIKLWIGFLILFFLALGITSYQQAVELLSSNESIAEQLQKDLTPRLEEKITSTSSQKIEQQLRKNDAAFEQHLANIQAKAENRLLKIKNDFNSKLNMVAGYSKSLEPAVVEAFMVDSGYAFYGIRTNNDWAIRSFKILGDSPSQPPKPGEIVEAVSNVNIRDNYLTFGSIEWSNAEILGVLIPGDRVNIKDIREVSDGYFWIKFDNRHKQN